METSILAYFLKVNLALAILYICYRLLFRDDTFSACEEVYCFLST